MTVKQAITALKRKYGASKSAGVEEWRIFNAKREVLCELQQLLRRKGQ